MKLFSKVTGGFRDKVVNNDMEDQASDFREVVQRGDPD